MPLERNLTMKSIDRREFLGTLAAGAAWFTPSRPQKPRVSTDLAIGVQTWVVREAFAADPAGTLADLNSQGYRSIEMCSPAGYANYGFGPIAEIATPDLKAMIADAGMECFSSHFTSVELRENLEQSIEFAHTIGLSQMVLSHPGIGADSSMDDWKRVCEEISGWGRTVVDAGLHFAYHNHNFEFEKVDDRLIYDILLEELDPKAVKLQFQVWVVSIGYHAADYFTAHPGRFISAHLADYSGEGTEQVPVGQGVVDWPAFFEAGKVGGLQNIYVEMGPELLPGSAEYLASLG